MPMDDIVITDGKPRDSLSTFILRYSHLRVDRDPGFRLQVSPDAESHLLYPLNAAVELQTEAGSALVDKPLFIGPYDRPFKIKAWRGTEFIIALLARFSIPSLFGVPAQRHADSWIRLDEAVPGSLSEIPALAKARLAASARQRTPDGPDLVDLTFAMLDQALSDLADTRKREADANEADREIAKVLWDADPCLTVAALAEAHGWPRRRMVAASQAAGGFTPKLLRRVARAALLRERLLAASDGVDLAGLAVDCGYADQAHAVRDLSLYSGFTPALLKRKFPGFREGWLRTRTRDGRNG